MKSTIVGDGDIARGAHSSILKDSCHSITTTPPGLTRGEGVAGGSGDDDVMSELVVVQEDSEAGQGPNPFLLAPASAGTALRPQIRFQARVRLIGPGEAGES
jgi:hypothetical protein